MSDAQDQTNVAPASEAKCEARLLGGVFECVPCALAWDETDPAPRPACGNATFTRLVEAVLAEALRIEGSQRALVAAGDRAFRYRPQLTRAMELRACAAALEKYRETLHRDGGF